jgi:MFS family permease
MTVGSVLATLLVVTWATVDSLLGFYLIWAAIGVVMASVFYEPAFVVVANWFQRLRGRALTLLTFVGGFASVIYIPLASWLVQNYGWRSALLILATILAIGTIPIHALMLHQHPRDIGLQPDGGRQPAHEAAASKPAQMSTTLHDALRDRTFWWITAGFVLATIATMAVIVHLIPYLVTRGYSPGFAASAAGLIGALALPGRLIFTPLGARIERRWVIALIFAMQTASLVILLQVQNTAGIFIFVVLFGAGFGAITPARAALVTEIYGPAHYGSISSVIVLCTTGARAVAPVGAGLLYTGTNSYTPVLWLLVVMSALASVAALRAKPAFQPLPGSV